MAAAAAAATHRPVCLVDPNTATPTVDVTECAA